MPLVAKILTVIICLLLFIGFATWAFFLYRKNEKKKIKNYGYWNLLLCGMSVIFLFVGIYACFW